jgi:hypothetical protein
MMFSLADPRMLGGVEVGDLIDFDVRLVDGSHEILSVVVDRLNTSALVNGESSLQSSL